MEESTVQKDTLKGNILLIGNAGVGKSTLINAVIGENVAAKGHGISGTTKRLKPYESDQVPFRLIDTVGFAQKSSEINKAIDAVKQWSKDAAKKGRKDTSINVIWFCVDGTSSKLFPETIKNFTKAVSMWPSVPVIAVITKSYSELERERNIDMVRAAFEAVKTPVKCQEIIPVVADTYSINKEAYAPPCGITELIDSTNRLLPEGIKAARKDLRAYKLKRKRILAQSVVAAATASAAVVGAVPLPIPDASILAGVEMGEIKAIASIYNIKRNDELFKSFVETGTISLAAKSVVSAVKAIPGLNLITSTLNALIAAAIVVTFGEGLIYAFEQIYLRKKSIDDIDWIKKVLESNFINTVTEDEAFQSVIKSADAKNVAQKLMEFIFGSGKKSKKKYNQ